MRHNLSFNKIFYRVPRDDGSPGKGAHWTSRDISGHGRASHVGRGMEGLKSSHLRNTFSPMAYSPRTGLLPKASALDVLASSAHASDKVGIHSQHTYLRPGYTTPSRLSERSRNDSNVSSQIKATEQYFQFYDPEFKTSFSRQAAQQNSDGTDSEIEEAESPTDPVIFKFTKKQRMDSVGSFVSTGFDEPKLQNKPVSLAEIPPQGLPIAHLVEASESKASVAEVETEYNFPPEADQ